MKKVTKHTSPLAIAQAVYKGQELDVSPGVQTTHAYVEMASELLRSTGSKMETALKLKNKLKMSLSSAYYYISLAQEQDQELDQDVRKFFVWMVLEHAVELLDRLKKDKKNPKEEVGLLKVLSELIDKHMNAKEGINWAEVNLPEILVLQSLPEQVKSEWVGKSDKEIEETLIKVLKLDENPEDGSIEDIEFEDADEA
ncbi:hypothetical protein [Siphonobacter sp.]|uniref:hypothetical protein n=1 Tax=Siphonobacter sp. TaxID=1869184 RepID=UPI003B3B480C